MLSFRNLKWYRLACQMNDIKMPNWHRKTVLLVNFLRWLEYICSEPSHMYLLPFSALAVLETLRFLLGWRTVPVPYQTGSWAPAAVPFKQNQSCLHRLNPLLRQTSQPELIRSFMQWHQGWRCNHWESKAVRMEMIFCSTKKKRRNDDRKPPHFKAKNFSDQKQLSKGIACVRALASYTLAKTHPEWKSEIFTWF